MRPHHLRERWDEPVEALLVGQPADRDGHPAVERRRRARELRDCVRDALHPDCVAEQRLIVGAILLDERHEHIEAAVTASDLVAQRVVVGPQVDVLLADDEHARAGQRRREDVEGGSRRHHDVRALSPGGAREEQVGPEAPPPRHAPVLGKQHHRRQAVLTVVSKRQMFSRKFRDGIGPARFADGADHCGGSFIGIECLWPENLACRKCNDAQDMLGGTANGTQQVDRA